MKRQQMIKRLTISTLIALGLASGAFTLPTPSADAAQCSCKKCC